MESEPKILPLSGVVAGDDPEPMGSFAGRGASSSDRPPSSFAQPVSDSRPSPDRLWFRVTKIKKWIALLMLAGLAALTAPRWIARLPSLLDESKSTTAQVDPRSLIPPKLRTLAPGIPTDRIPEYTIDQFNYVSAQGKEKQWNLLAETAYLYNKEKLVHARQVKAFLFNPDGKPTIVTGLEAKYFMNQRDLEVYGNVKTFFPDGFELDSEYLRYKPNDKIITIPEEYFVHGFGKNSEKDQNLSFTSHGFRYEMKRSMILLPADVHAEVAEPNPSTIISDRCVIDRDKQIAHFTMYPYRPLATRFVHVIQPTMNAKGRYADLNYGDFKQMLNYLTLHEDVLVRELSNDSLRYSTSGQADFDAKRNLIILRKYPQVYQDNDTVTGDVILMHRDTDIVEVEESNAFTQGSP